MPCGCMGYKPEELENVVQNYLRGRRSISAYLREDLALVNRFARSMTQEGVRDIAELERMYGRNAVVTVVKAAWNAGHEDYYGRLKFLGLPSVLEKPQAVEDFVRPLKQQKREFVA